MQVLSGESQESPQEAYFFYYRVNELFGVRYGDWKMYFPHRYRTMAGQPQGADGLPGQYAFIDMKEIELYHLPTDEAERTNVATISSRSGKQNTIFGCRYAPKIRRCPLGSNRQ